MPTDLDTRIRELVFDVVDLTPPAPELPLLEPARPRARRLHRHAAVVAMVAALLVALLVGTVALTRDDTGPGAPAAASPGRVVVALASIPQGVTAARLGGHHVFYVRVGDDVTVFLDRAQHLPGERLWWCLPAYVFQAPTHGETFAPDGTRLGGPARRGLDRFAARVRGRTLVVRLDTLVKGALVSGPGGSSPPYPGSFPSDPCADPVRHPHGEPLGPWASATPSS